MSEVLEIVRFTVHADQRGDDARAVARAARLFAPVLFEPPAGAVAS